MEETYAFDRLAFPEPVIEGKPEWVELYYKAWKNTGGVPL